MSWFSKLKNWFHSKNELTECLIDSATTNEALLSKVKSLQAENAAMLYNHTFVFKCLILQNDGDLVISPELQTLAAKSEDSPWIENLSDGTFVLKLKSPQELELLQREPEFMEDDE